MWTFFAQLALAALAAAVAILAIGLSIKTIGGFF